MKRKSNRLLSILLTMVMLLSLLPTTAFAVESTPITSVKVSVTEPVIGAKPDFNVIITGEGAALDKDNTFHPICWCKYDPGDRGFSKLGEDDTFGAGIYMFELWLKPEAGYEFADAAKFYFGEEELLEYKGSYESTSTYERWGEFIEINLYFTLENPAGTTYTVSFAANGGTGSMTAVTGVSGEYTLPECIFTAPVGQRFKCWYDGDNYRAASDKITVTADTIVTAVWEDIPVTTYTVSFDANGGTGTMADKTGISGEYTLPANEFTAPSGKQFKAWSVDRVEKAAGEKITVTANTTVTALWEDIPVAPKTLDSIAITTPPTKTAYIAGESFDSTGMVVTATYSDSSTAPVTGYTVAPDGVLGMSNTEITVTYTEDGIVKTATQAITVAPADGSGDSGSDDSGSDDTSTVTPSTPSVPEYVNPFTDVSEGDYFYDAVKWAVQNDITTGTTDTTFSPDMVCSRAQAVTFLYRAAGSPDAKGEMPFSDVAEDAYYHDAVLWAIEKGITKGISETEFAPDMVCTREQIVTFLYRMAVSLGKDVSVGEDTNILSYDDAFDIGEWAIPAMQWACGAGVMNGTSESTLSPQMECTRGQIVTFLYRTFK